MARDVVIIGGGIGGLTAAHELCERGFSVTIYEKNFALYPGKDRTPIIQPVLGGKARSSRVPGGSRTSKIADLPAEHGFHFFPGFYQHLTNSLSRIPVGGGKTVLDRLVDVKSAALARRGGVFAKLKTELPRTISGFYRFLKHQLLETPGLGLNALEAGFAASRLLTGMTMCRERREVELENVPWSTFMHSDEMSEAYRTVVVQGLTQNFVAMDADRTSTRTAITILARLIDNFLTPGETVDRILDGPATDNFITPWHKYLEENGVKFKTGIIDQFLYDKIINSIVGVKLHDIANPVLFKTETVCIAAVPVEEMVNILDNSHDVSDADTSLELLGGLYVNWMSGVTYYLQRDMTFEKTGHIVYLDSSWALTSISQNQFWRKKVDQYGDHKVHGIVSSIISDWFKAGNGGVFRRRAADADNAGIVSAEALAQMKSHLQGVGDADLDETNVVGSYLDSDIIFDFTRETLRGLMTASAFAAGKIKLIETLQGEIGRPKREESDSNGARNESDTLERDLKEKRKEPNAAERKLLKLQLHAVRQNVEPLFINTVGSWSCRPTESTKIENLFLASDYIRTNTDLATMEGANEAARRAVNAILDWTRSKRPRCEVFDFDEPEILKPFRAIDRRLFEFGLPHPSFLGDQLFSVGARAAGRVGTWFKSPSQY